MPHNMSIEEWKRNKIARGDLTAGLQTFLEALDRSDLVLTDWEADFVANYLQARSEGRGQGWFSDGRIEAAIRMQEKYHVQLNLPGSVKFATPQAKFDLTAAPGCCMFLVSDPGHPQRPCNDAAVCQTRTGFRYCEIHRETAAEACRRKKVPFNTQALAAGNAKLCREAGQKTHE